MFGLFDSSWKRADSVYIRHGNFVASHGVSTSTCNLNKVPSNASVNDFSICNDRIIPLQSLTYSGTRRYLHTKVSCNVYSEKSSEA